jgi:amidohydrolase
MLDGRFVPVASLVTVMTGLAAYQASADLHGRIASHVEAHQGEFIALRRDIHRHPELSGREVRTAGVIATRLKALGLDVRTDVGGHGVASSSKVCSSSGLSPHRVG